MSLIKQFRHWEVWFICGGLVFSGFCLGYFLGDAASIPNPGVMEMMRLDMQVDGCKRELTRCERRIKETVHLRMDTRFPEQASRQ